MCLCCREACAFPFKDPVNAPVLGCCFITILPEVGIFVPAPGAGTKPAGTPAGAPPVAEMER